MPSNEAMEFAREAVDRMKQLATRGSGVSEEERAIVIGEVLDAFAARAVVVERKRCEAVTDPDQWAYKTVNAFTCLRAAQGAISSGRQPMKWGGA